MGFNGLSDLIVLFLKVIRLATMTRTEMRGNLNHESVTLLTPCAVLWRTRNQCLGKYLVAADRIHRVLLGLPFSFP